MRVRSIVVCLTALCLAGSACRPSPKPTAAAADTADDPCGLALAPLAAPGPLADPIAAQQRRAGEPRATEAALEQLGYLFVARARLTHDDGMYVAALATS